MVSLKSKEDTREKRAVRHHCSTLTFKISLFKKLHYSLKMDYKLIQLFEGQFGSIRKTFMIKFGKYMCVSRNKKHTKMFTGLSLAGKFMGDFYFPLNIF